MKITITSILLVVIIILSVMAIVNYLDFKTNDNIQSGIDAIWSLLLVGWMVMGLRWINEDGG